MRIVYHYTHIHMTATELHRLRIKCYTHNTVCVEQSATKRHKKSAPIIYTHTHNIYVNFCPSTINRTHHTHYTHECAHTPRQKHHKHAFMYTVYTQPETQYKRKKNITKKKYCARKSVAAIAFLFADRDNHLFRIFNLYHNSIKNNRNERVKSKTVKIS